MICATISLVVALMFIRCSDMHNHSVFSGGFMRISVIHCTLFVFVNWKCGTQCSMNAVCLGVKFVFFFFKNSQCVFYFSKGLLTVCMLIYFIYIVWSDFDPE